MKATKLLYMLLITAFFAACSAPAVVKVWSDEKHVIEQKAAHKFIFFVQSNNQINSRIAMDRLVAMSANPSVQGYLYTQGERINAGNREFYRTKMKADGYDYVVAMVLKDTLSEKTYIPDGNTPGNRSFYGDYSFQIDPYAYNPGYQRENKIFIIETSVYYVETGNLVWTCLSKLYNPQSVEQAVTETSKEVIKKMKKQGFMR